MSERARTSEHGAAVNDAAVASLLDELADALARRLAARLKEERPLTLAEASELLRLEEPLVRRLAGGEELDVCGDAALPHRLTADGELVFYRDDLEAWLARWGPR